jgi:type I restriction enzyme S subunit
LELDDVAFIGEDTHAAMAGTQLHANDVLLNITGASIGRCTYVPEGFGEGNVNQHVCIIRPAAGVNHRFLSYCLAAPWGQDQILSAFTGASRQGLGQRDLGEIQIPLPRIAEQIRIAAYLDASCDAIDAMVVAKRQQIEALDLIRATIIETTVTRGVAKRTKYTQIDHDWIESLPDHWSATRIKRVLSQVDYGISVSTEAEGRYPVLKMGNIQAGEIVLSKMGFVNEVEPGLLLAKNDLLYNRTNSPDQVGKAALFRGSEEDGITFASYLVRLRVNHRMTAEFLNYVVNCAGFLGFARKLAIPSVQQSNLNSTRYCQLLVPLPPMREQQAICELLGEKLEALKQVVSTIESQIETLIAYRKSLIHECVTGQRRVTAPDVDWAKAYAEEQEAA